MPNITEQHVKDALEVLGDDTESVARSLFNGGWLGRMAGARTCPIAEYLRTVVRYVDAVLVGSTAVTVRLYDDSDLVVRLTPAAEGFVFAFDLGVYPELIATADVRSS